MPLEKDNSAMLKSLSKSLLSSLINYILPHRCALCSELTDEHNNISAGVCAKCFLKINFITAPYCNICGFPFEFAIEGMISCANCIAKPPQCNLSRSLFKFDYQSRNLIHSFKYNDNTI